VTPAITTLEALNISFELLSFDYRHADAGEVGLAAARALDLDPVAVYKTLVAALGVERLVVAVIPVAQQLDLKQLARLCGAKQAALAERASAERATGYRVGGISPVGQRRTLETYLDEQALLLPKIFVSAGKRGLELGLRPSDLVLATGAQVARLAAAD